MNLILPLAGGCWCGEIRYTVTQPLLTCYLCHCHLCQKRSGSAFSMQVVVPDAGFAITAGEPLRQERLWADGERGVSLHCPQCQGRIGTRGESWGSITLRAGTLDDVGDLRPALQIWTSSAQTWAIQTNMLSFAESPDDFAVFIDAWRDAQERTQ